MNILQLKIQIKANISGLWGLMASSGVMPGEYGCYPPSLARDRSAPCTPMFGSPRRHTRAQKCPSLPSMHCPCPLKCPWLQSVSCYPTYTHARLHPILPQALAYSTAPLTPSLPPTQTHPHRPAPGPLSPPEPSPASLSTRHPLQSPHPQGNLMHHPACFQPPSHPISRPPTPLSPQPHHPVTPYSSTPHMLLPPESP